MASLARDLGVKIIIHEKTKEGQRWTSSFFVMEKLGTGKNLWLPIPREL
jgi:hypothetical protein